MIKQSSTEISTITNVASPTVLKHLAFSRSLTHSSVNEVLKATKKVVDSVLVSVNSTPEPSPNPEPTPSLLRIPYIEIIN